MAEDRFFSNYEQCLRPAYIEQIRALRDGPLRELAGDESAIKVRIADYLMSQTTNPEHLTRILRYATSKCPVFLVIDNVDQLDEHGVQEKVFSESIALATRANLNLVLAMRDATFVQNRSSPVLNAFDFVPITIDAPAIPAVLSRRFFLAKQILSGRRGSFTAENGAHIEMSDLSIVVDMVSAAVLGTNIGTVIDVLATSDIRLALRMTREFLESGYSNPGRAISAYQKNREYALPRHEALRSVLLGNQPVYSEEFSIIGNPFDARLSRSTHQLLRLFVLSGLVGFSSRPDFRYLEGTDIRDALRKIGFGDDACSKVLSDLCRLRFAFTSGHGVPTLGSSYYPSRLGGYVVKLLVSDPVFLEAVMMDTFIVKRETWEEMRALSERIEQERNVVTRLSLRHDRIRVFFEQMQAQYSIVLEEARRRALSAEWCADPLEGARTLLIRNLQRALDSARRNYA